MDSVLTGPVDPRDCNNRPLGSQPDAHHGPDFSHLTVKIVYKVRRMRSGLHGNR